MDLLEPDFPTLDDEFGLQLDQFEFDNLADPSDSWGEPTSDLSLSGPVPCDQPPSPKSPVATPTTFDKPQPHCPQGDSSGGLLSSLQDVSGESDQAVVEQIRGQLTQLHAKLMEAQGQTPTYPPGYAERDIESDSESDSSGSKERTPTPTPPPSSTPSVSFSDSPPPSHASPLPPQIGQSPMNGNAHVHEACVSLRGSRQNQKPQQSTIPNNKSRKRPRKQEDISDMVAMGPTNAPLMGTDAPCTPLMAPYPSPGSEQTMPMSMPNTPSGSSSNPYGMGMCGGNGFSPYGSQQGTPGMYCMGTQPMAYNPLQALQELEATSWNRKQKGAKMEVPTDPAVKEHIKREKNKAYARESRAKFKVKMSLLEQSVSMLTSQLQRSSSENSQLLARIEGLERIALQQSPAPSSQGGSPLSTPSLSSSAGYEGVEGEPMRKRRKRLGIHEMPAGPEGAGRVVVYAFAFCFICLFNTSFFSSILPATWAPQPSFPPKGGSPWSSQQCQSGRCVPSRRGSGRRILEDREGEFEDTQAAQGSNRPHVLNSDVHLTTNPDDFGEAEEAEEEINHPRENHRENNEPLA